MSNSSLSVEKKKPFFKMPHGYVIIIILLIVVSVTTYIVPAGSFERVDDPISGKTIIDPNSFAPTESNPVSILKIPSIIVKACAQQANIIFSILIISGALEIILETGMFHAFCGKLSRFCAKGGKEKFFIPGIMMVFLVLGLTQSTDKFIGFAPIGVMLALAMGYDAIVGIAMVLLGVGISFSAGPLHSTTAVAQSIAELPLYSGMSFRVIATVVLYVITVGYLSWYAARVKKDPTKSVLYQVEGVMQFDVTESEVEVEPKHYIILIEFIVGISVLMYGCIKWEWGIPESSALFIWVGLIGGLLYGFGPSKICKLFIKGATASTGAALVVGLGASVSIILSEAGIIDTVVNAISQTINYMPGFLKAPVMYIANTVINLLIPSGNGQAVVVMPIMAPMSDLVGISRQTSVLCFKLGDGLSNYVLPHAAALMGFLGVTGVPYDKWMKFMGKLFGLWVIASMIIVAVADMVGYA